MNRSDFLPLLPCPFCGGRADWHAGSDNENWAGATCKMCGVTLDDQDAGCMDRAADAWNSRFSESRAAPEPSPAS